MSDIPPQLGQKAGYLKAMVIAGLIVLVLTWAVTTLFAVAFVKALPAVVLGVFVVFVMLLLAGIG